MLRVGLTGGAGSGKSTVAAMLQELGAFVSRSDEVGRSMMQPREAVYRDIVEHFGPEVLNSDGHLDRTVLARIAFHDGRVEELNSIVHPAVIAAQNEWMDSVAQQSPEAVAVIESALIFETKHSATSESGPGAARETPWRTRFDRIVLVTAAEELRLSRYIARQNVSGSAEQQEAIRRDAHARFAAQMSDKEKAALSDYVLVNESSITALRRETERLYTQLKAEVSERSSEAM